ANPPAVSLMGNAVLWQRVLLTFTAYAIAAVGVFAAAYFGNFDFTSRATVRSPLVFATQLYACVMFQATCVIGFVSLASIVVQSLLKRRWAFRGDEVRRHGITIRDLLLATGLAALTLMFIRNNLNPPVDGVGFSRLDFVLYTTVISTIGTVPIVVFSFGRKLFPIVSAVWISAVAGLFLTACGLDPNSRYQIVFAHAFAGYLFGLAMWLLKRHGLELKHIDSPVETVVPNRRWNPRFSIAYILTIAIICALTCSHMQVQTFLTAPFGMKYSSARSVVRVAKLLGRNRLFPRTPPKELDPDAYFRLYRFSATARSLTINKADLSPELVHAALSAGSVWHGITLNCDTLSHEHAAPFAGKLIGRLTIKCTTVVDGALSILCDRSRVGEMRLECDRLSAADAMALADHVGSLTIHVERVESQEVIDALPTTRLKWLSVGLVEGVELDLSDVHCHTITIRNSRITKDCFQRLPNDSQTLVSFRGCKFDDDITNELFRQVESTLREIRIHE
ncbi:MAG: hypothetical protein KDB27_36015, partial [Planctomycetales bacterium]|nr:hypothetical protein [Planctomycetales bacterium]